MSAGTTPPRPILLTGFEPFDGETVNPSAEIARALDGAVIAGHPVRSGILPVEFQRSARMLRRAIEQLDPVLVLALGQAGGRAAISIERIAVNLIDARIPDNCGLQPIDTPVRRDEPAGRFAKLPLKAMLAAGRAAGLPVEVSLSAGTFVCNALFYHLLAAVQDRPGTRGGFIHVPWLPDQARRRGGPGLALEVQVETVRQLLAAVFSGTAPPSFSAGREH